MQVLAFVYALGAAVGGWWFLFRSAAVGGGPFFGGALGLPIRPGRDALIEPPQAPAGQAPLGGRSLDLCGLP